MTFAIKPKRVPLAGEEPIAGRIISYDSINQSGLIDVGDGEPVVFDTATFSRAGYSRIAEGAHVECGVIPFKEVRKVASISRYTPPPRNKGR